MTVNRILSHLNQNNDGLPEQLAALKITLERIESAADEKYFDFEDPSMDDFIGNELKFNLYSRVYFRVSFSGSVIQNVAAELTRASELLADAAVRVSALEGGAL